MITANSIKDYLIYPNESIDKLTVNRPLENLYNLITEIGGYDKVLTITEATSTEYGLTRMSTLTSFQYTNDGTAEYSSWPLTIPTLLDFASRQTASDVYAKYCTYHGDSSENNLYLRMKLGDCSYMQLPTGLNLIILSFDIGLNDIPVMLGNGVFGGNIDFPVAVSGYDTNIIYDDVSKSTVEVYKGESPSFPISSLFQREIGYDFMTDTSMTLHYHDCNWTSYSSFKQSYVEVTYSTYFNVLDLYDKFYSYNLVEDYNMALGMKYECVVSSNSTLKNKFIFNPRSVSSVFNYDMEKVFIYVNGRWEDSDDAGKEFTNWGAYGITWVDSSDKSTDEYDEIRWTAEMVNLAPHTADNRNPFPRPRNPFSQKPIILSQIAFYNNDSRSKILLGTFDEDTLNAAFDDSSEISEKRLTEVDIGKSDDNTPLMVSPVNGNVILKKYQNVYTKSGKIKDNQLFFDVNMKFLAGSADDPSMHRTIRNINAKARVQIMMLGV